MEIKSWRTLVSLKFDVKLLFVFQTRKFIGLIYAFNKYTTIFRTFNPITSDENYVKKFVDESKSNYGPIGPSLCNSSATQVGPYIWIQGLKYHAPKAYLIHRTSIFICRIYFI